jgi:hypothetical protein
MGYLSKRWWSLLGCRPLNTHQLFLEALLFLRVLKGLIGLLGGMAMAHAHFASLPQIKYNNFSHVLLSQSLQISHMYSFHAQIF